MQISTNYTEYSNKNRVTKFTICGESFWSVCKYEYNKFWGWGYYNPIIFDSLKEAMDYGSDKTSY